MCARLLPGTDIFFLLTFHWLKQTKVYVWLQRGASAHAQKAETRRGDVQSQGGSMPAVQCLLSALLAGLPPPQPSDSLSLS